jgi:flagellar motor switch protein FliM
MTSVKPFQFKNLPRYTRVQANCLQSLSAYLSQRPFQQGFRSHICEILQEALKVPAKLSGVDIQPIDARNLKSMLPAQSCFALLGAAPGTHKIIVDIDPALVTQAIDRLLGGDGQTAVIRRSLTQVEQGVVSFMLLKLIGTFYDGWTSGREVALTLDDFLGTRDELENIIEDDTDYYLFGLKASLGDCIGYARILLPARFIETFAKPIAQSGGTPEELEHMRQVLRQVADQEVEMKVEAGRLELSPGDIATLEAGDIIILEHHQLTLTPEGPTGNISAYIGAGNNGRLQGQLVIAEGQLKFAISQILVQEQPIEAPMTDELTDEPTIQEVTDNLPETEGLLRDIDAPVVIELGRLKMNTAQVARLKSGQILRLPRNANDPVDLVVNDKLFARGELVEIDGELGVRLVHVTGVS